MLQWGRGFAAAEVAAILTVLLSKTCALPRERCRPAPPASTMTLEARQRKLQRVNLLAPRERLPAFQRHLAARDRRRPMEHPYRASNPW